MYYFNRLMNHMAAPKATLAVIAILSLAIPGRFAAAAVSIAEASRLKSDLTPLGAEKSGNKEGTIPAWEGGYTKVWPGYRSGQPRPDPFAGEKPILQITAKNAAQYADKLSDGVMALLRRDPTYRLDIYATHRTAAAPQWVYDNTSKNATSAKTIHKGLTVQSAYGGIPFPIPGNGNEAMWNYALMLRCESCIYDNSTYVVIDGKPVLTSSSSVDLQYPYYYQEGSVDSFGGIYSFAKVTITAPPLSAGENLLVIDPVDYAGSARKAWQSLVGQRRVRRVPTIGYDTPNLSHSGFSFFDEVALFNGAMDRYEWKLLGKKELFIPYNTHAFQTAKIEQVLGPNHINPEYLRWELHRVWVVEATLAPGKGHALHRRRFYLDEDSWLAVLSDGWDAQGQLWRTGATLPIIVPELPAVVSPSYVIYDFQKRGYVAANRILPRRPERDFSPAMLSSEGIR